MLNTITTIAVDAVSTGTNWADFAKPLMIGLALAAAAFSLGMVASNYMKALGRNPEAGDKATQLIILAAMIELTALLGLAAAFVV